MIERRANEHPPLLEVVVAFTGAFVAVAILALTAVTTWFLLTHEIPKDNQTIVGQLQGSLWTSLGMVVAYFYGSSASSRTKDRALESMAKTAQSVQAASAPTPDVTIPAGGSATVKAEEDGK